MYLLACWLTSYKQGITPLYKLLILLAFGPDINALGSEDYATREAAEYRLSCWADLCWPLLNNTHSPDLEVRKRIARIKRSYMPDNPPPIALLAGSPLTEWCIGDPYEMGVIGAYPGIEYRLSWLRPDKKGNLSILVWYYGEKARTQYTWKDWHLDCDGRMATKLMLRDMERLGIHPVATRALVSYLRDKEARLYYPPEKLPLPAKEVNQ